MRSCGWGVQCRGGGSSTVASPRWARHATGQRDKNEPEIIAALERVGATVCKLDKPVDLLVAYEGMNFLLEVKPPDEGQGRRHRQRKDLAERLARQLAWCTSWPAPAAMVSTADEALRAIGARIEQGDRVVACVRCGYAIEINSFDPGPTICRSCILEGKG
jgi:hypothetical protein